jgi:hypothetical protein
VTSDHHIIAIALLRDPMIDDPNYRAAMGIDLPDDDTSDKAA